MNLNDVTTCQWSGNACSIKSTIPDIINERDGVFGLKSSILIFLISIFLDETKYF